jgi:hypothetical protein
MRYVRCKTCGKYLESTLTIGNAFCSEACAAGFVRCTNCGGYFPKGGGYDAETCSQACSIRYAISRNHGVTPTEATSEEKT